MRALDAAQIDADLGFERGIDRLAEIMTQQHIFGRNGGVGLQLEQTNGRPARCSASSASRGVADMTDRDRVSLMVLFIA